MSFSKHPVIKTTVLSVSLLSLKKCMYDKVSKNSLCVRSKQWPLAGEFIEFEYSPKIRRFWGVRVLAKRAIFGNMQDSPDSPPFAEPFTEDSPDSPTFAKPFTEYSPDSPTFAKPFTEDSPDSLKVSLASITRV
jgi:hypothetical protein